MKNNLLIIISTFISFSGAAQDIPGYIRQFVPFHAYLENNRPAVTLAGGNSDSTSLDVAYAYYAGDSLDTTQMLKDSSDFNYVDSLNFPLQDTTLGYNVGQWSPDSEFSVSFNANHQKVSEIGQTYSSAWTNNYQYLYSYDVNNRPDSVVYQTWAGSWANAKMTAYAYNNSNLLTSKSNFIYTGGAWMPDTQYVYLYNTLNQDSQVLMNIGQGTGWASHLQFNYQYTPVTSRFTGMNISIWDTAQWDTFETVTYARDSNESSTVVKRYASALYVTTYEEEYEYDDCGNIINYELDSIDYNNPDDYYPLYTTYYYYDECGGYHLVEGGSLWGYDPNSHIVVYPYAFYYYYRWNGKKSPVNIENTGNTFNAGIFPNPSGGEATIRLNTTASSALKISVFDAAGRSVLEMNANVPAGNNRVPLHLQQLAAGNYLVKLLDPHSGKSCTLKWVKQ